MVVSISDLWIADELAPPASLNLYLPTDISAAKHADILFVKTKDDGENDLAAYCTREDIKHILFKDFSAALPIVESIVRGGRSIDDFVENTSR